VWRVPAVPSAVSDLRRSLLGRIAGRGFDVEAVALAVTEAVTNVVRHAYPGSEGMVTLTAELSADELVVVVMDEGVGSRGLTMSASPGMGIGLALIRQLSTGAFIEPTKTTGTTVTMHFAKL
jgi:serine/threonine-protein kinase RsbW